METAISKKIENVSNVMIIVVSFLLVVVLVKDHWFIRGRPASSQSVVSANQIAAGTRLITLDVD